MTSTGAPLRAKKRHIAIPLSFVAFLSYLDWMTHRSLVFVVIVGGSAAGIIICGPRMLEALGIAAVTKKIPPAVRSGITAIPALYYFSARGEEAPELGSSHAKDGLFWVMVILIGVTIAFGRTIDQRLGPFYRIRNRVFPRPLRSLVVLVAPVLIAFLLVHGSLGDLSALAGGTTKQPMLAAGRENRIILSAVVSAMIAFLMLREAPRGS